MTAIGPTGCGISGLASFRKGASKAFGVSRSLAKPVEYLVESLLPARAWQLSVVPGPPHAGVHDGRHFSYSRSQDTRSVSRAASRIRPMPSAAGTSRPRPLGQTHRGAMTE